MILARVISVIFLLNFAVLLCKSQVLKRPSYTPTSTPSSFPTPLKCDSALSCKTINIFNESYCSNLDDRTTVCISDLTCYGITILGFPSKYIKPNTIQAGINGLATYCVGFLDLLIEGRKDHDSSGYVSVFVNDTDIVSDVTIKKDKDTTFPIGALVPICTVTSMLVDIKISIKERSLDLDKEITKIIKAKLSLQLCSALREFVSVNVTSFIQNTIDPRLELLVKEGVPSPIPAIYTINASHYVHWSDSIISTVHSLVNILTGDHTLLKCTLDNKKTLFNVLERAVFSNQVPDCINLKIKDIRENLSELETVLSLTTGANIVITQVTICGVRNIKDLSLFEPSLTSNVTLQSFLMWESIEASLTLNVTRGLHEESLLVSLSLSNVSVIADLIVAVDADYLGSLYLDQLFESKLDCILLALRELSIPSLQLIIRSTQVTVSDVHGSAANLQEDFIQLINNVFILIFDGFGDTVTLSVNAFAQSKIRSIANFYLQQWTESLLFNRTCPPHSEGTSDGNFISWNSSSLITEVDKVVNGLVGANGLNSLLGCLTGGTGIVDWYFSDLHLQISGIDSFYDLNILQPFPSEQSRPYDLHNQIAVGFCGNSSCKPLTLSISRSTSVGYGSLPTIGPLRLALSNISLDLDLLLKISYKSMADLQYGQLGTKGCVASAVTALSLEYLLIDLLSASMGLGKDRNFDVTRLFKKLFASLEDPSHIAKTNSDIVTKLNSSELICESGGVSPDSDDIIPPSIESDQDDSNWEWQIALVVIGSISALVIFLLCYHFWNEKIAFESMNDTNSKLISNSLKTSIFSSQIIPLWVKIGVPISVCINIAIFLYSNYCPDAVSVQLQILIGSTFATTPKTIFNFGLASTVSDMWNGGIYPLAILIAFFSGAWPYIKLLFMLFSWFAPPSYLSIASRSSYLQLLDSLGKWSLIDSFVMLLMLCAFYLNIYIGNELTVKVIVQPNIGFNLFLLATMMSLAMGHIVQGCHRVVVEPKIQRKTGYTPTYESLSSYVYSVKVMDPPPSDKSPAANEMNALTQPLIESENESNLTSSHEEVLKLVVTRFGYILFLSLLLITCLFIFLGTFELTMGFEFKGLTGWILQDAATVDYSYVTVGSTAPEHSGNTDDFTIHWVQVCYFLFGIAMPLSSLIALAVLWIIPITVELQVFPDFYSPLTLTFNIKIN